MGKISKTGIAPQQQIKAEHITRIIDALSGETPSTQIEISGSVTASYFIGDGSGLTNLPIPSGSGGGSIDTGSFAITGSNTFIGDQFISGNIEMTNNQFIQIGDEFDGIFLGNYGFKVYRDNYTSQIIVNQNSFSISNNDNGISFNITSGSTPYHFISSSTQGRTNFFQHPLQSGEINLNYPSQSGTLALEGYDLRPYKVYTALLTQIHEEAPVATVLENTLGQKIIFSYLEPGNYPITNKDLFKEGKTCIFFGREGFAGTSAPVVTYSLNLPDSGFYNKVQITSSDQGTSLTTLDNLIKDVLIEIRVYN